MLDCNVEVNSALIGSDMEKIASSLNVILNQMKDFESEVNTLCTNWQGDANAAFVKNVQEDIGTMSKFLGELAAFNNCLGEACNEYVSTENEIYVYIAGLNT